ncbi:MAG: DUF7737 domain-containing protein [Planctomycetales bacterium]
MPKQATSKKSDGMFLPFEGEGTLSIILNKALLLPEDAKHQRCDDYQPD